MKQSLFGIFAILSFALEVRRHSSLIDILSRTLSNDRPLNSSQRHASSSTSTTKSGELPGQSASRATLGSGRPMAGGLRILVVERTTFSPRLVQPFHVG